MAVDRIVKYRFWALHIAGLWSIGVVQPLFDVLGNNPEFFVAHATRGRDLLGLVIVMCVLGPLCIVVPILLAAKIGRRIYQVGIWVAMFLLVTVLALPIVKQIFELDTGDIFATAAAMGMVFAFGYVLLSSVRLFAMFLSLGTIVIPFVFLFQPSIEGLLRAEDRAPLADVEFTTTPPVVMVVFDQLPLPSLLNNEGSIDEKLYPNFSSLSRQASWFRNASAVGALTNVALPSILTGKRPSNGLLPTTDDHPENLFTLLSSSYRVEAFEPLTRLCPSNVCSVQRQSLVNWYTSVLFDLYIAYQHIVLPEQMAASLPSVTQDWKNFVNNNSWRGRWREQRTNDRKIAVNNFIDLIGTSFQDDRPPFYFLHVLLPHEPWIYLPSGKRFSLIENPSGLSPRSGFWTDDVVAVARNYQRHLLQVRYVDALLGSVLDRMREVGLYDDTLLVVTADHGASFQPGFSFRSPHRESFVDHVSVPLFIKLPQQQSGAVLRSNIETIDVVPTLAALLGSRLPWEVDGVDVFNASVEPRENKVLFYGNPLQRMVGPPDLEPAIESAVAKKYQWFEVPDGFHSPMFGLYRELIGRRVNEFKVVATEDIQVTVDFPKIFGETDLNSDFIPAHVTGTARHRDGNVEPNRVAPLALAVNGILAGTTEPYGFPLAGRSQSWEVIIDPQLVRNGANLVEVFLINAMVDESIILARAYTSEAARMSANLIREESEELWGVSSSGFYPTEWNNEQPFRWTREQASLLVPIDQDAPPSELMVRVSMTGPVTKHVSLFVNECTLFEGAFNGAWNETFSLFGCSLDSDEVEIRLETEVHNASFRPNAREIGIAISVIELRE